MPEQLLSIFGVQALLKCILGLRGDIEMYRTLSIGINCRIGSYIYIYIYGYISLIYKVFFFIFYF